jgi:hypothetical protein
MTCASTMARSLVATYSSASADHRASGTRVGTEAAHNINRYNCSQMPERSVLL